MYNSRQDKIENFLRKLIKECYKENAYSVIEATEKVGVSYSELQELAKVNETVANRLRLCREVCYGHAFSDGLTRKITAEKSLKYQCENDDEFREKYEKEQATELKSKLEKQGKEMPSTQPKRIVMIENLTTKPAEQLVRANTSVNLAKNIPTFKQKTQIDIEQERLELWKEKQKGMVPCITFKQEILKDKDGKETTKLTGTPVNATQASYDLARATYYAATGSADFTFAIRLQTQVGNALFKAKDENQADTLNAINAVLLSLNPKDEYEGMLCSRLLVLHDQYMEFMRRSAISGQTDAGVDLNINRATKLMRLYNETLDALNKHRRKGEQKVTVQHVNVSDGGQAIVNGQINQGEGNIPKSKGAGHAN